MARNYSSGSIAVGTAALAGAALQTAYRDAIILNSAWTVVEEFVSSDTTRNHVILKCAAATSGLAADYYVAISRTVATGALIFQMGDTYNTGTHVLSNALVDCGTATSIAFDANGIPTTVPTMTFAVNQVAANGAASGNYTGTPAASLFWQCVADVDHFVISGLTVGMPLYIGAITSFMASDPMPIGIINLSSAATPLTAGNQMLRLPPGATSPQSRQLWTVHGPAQSIPVMRASASASSEVLDHCLGDKGASWEIAVCHQTATAAAVGCVRGKMKKTLYLSATPAGSAVGDIFPLDGNRWMLFNGGAGPLGHIIDSGIAV